MKKRIKKFVRFSLFSVLGLIIALNLFVVLSGRFYLYKGFANTYLIGQAAPSIYDMDVFSSDTLKPSKLPLEFNFHPKYNTQKIPKDYREYIESVGTKALIISKGDTLVYEEYWDEHEEHTVSNSFSMSKTIVALLVGIAVDEGKIKSLDDFVGDYLPEFKLGERNCVTIRDLLVMASGLDWEESAINPLSDNAESYYGTGLYGQVTRQKLISESGKIFNYQSGNSQLLSFIVEKATNQKIADYAAEKIWSKIGAKHNAYWNLDKEEGNAKAFCCFHAEARDFVRLGLVVLNKGMHEGKQIIPRWFYDEMIAPANITTADGLVNYRYGLHIWTYLGNADPVYYFRGKNGQYIITIPDQNLLIVRLGERRKQNFVVPDHLKNDSIYVEQNKYEVGHSVDLFQYIALGKMLSSQIKE